MRNPPHQQPQVSKAYRLLASYIHEGVKLDLFGTLDEEGYEVFDIALAGTNISLFELVPTEFLERLSTWCNDKLPSPREVRIQSAMEAQYERMKWAREYA